MATKNIDTMIRHIEKVQTDINNLADEKWNQYADLTQFEQISARGNNLRTTFNCLYKAFGIIDDAIRELEHAKKTNKKIKEC